MTKLQEFFWPWTPKIDTKIVCLFKLACENEVMTVDEHLDHGANDFTFCAANSKGIRLAFKTRKYGVHWKLVEE